MTVSRKNTHTHTHTHTERREKTGGGSPRAVRGNFCFVGAAERFYIFSVGG